MNWSIDPLLELQIWTRLAAMAYGQATSHDLFQAICSRALALDKPALFRPDSYVFCVGVCVGVGVGETAGTPLSIDILRINQLLLYCK